MKDFALHMAHRNHTIALLKSLNIWTVIKPRLLLSMLKCQPNHRALALKCKICKSTKTFLVGRFSITRATKPRKDSRVGLTVLTTVISVRHQNAHLYQISRLIDEFNSNYQIE